MDESCRTAAKHQVTLVMDDRQADVVNRALDLYARIGMGQLEELLDLLRMREYDSDRHEDWEQVESLIGYIKQLVWGHPPHGSWGIANPKVPPYAREAYDITQVLRKTLATARLTEMPHEQQREALRMSVHFREYLPAHPEWPPVGVAVVDLPEKD